MHGGNDGGVGVGAGAGTGAGAGEGAGVGEEGVLSPELATVQLRQRRSGVRAPVHVTRESVTTLEDGFGSEEEERYFGDPALRAAEPGHGHGHRRDPATGWSRVCSVQGCRVRGQQLCTRLRAVDWEPASWMETVGCTSAGMRRLRDKWEDWASTHLPARASPMRVFVLTLLVVCVVLVVCAVLAAALYPLYAYRGTLLVRAGKRLEPHEAVDMGLALAEVVPAHHLPLNIHPHDDEATKLRKFQHHRAAIIVPHDHMASGCASTSVTAHKMQVRAGQFTGSDPLEWGPIAPAKAYAYPSPALQGVLPIGCHDGSAGHDVDLIHFIDHAKALMRTLRHTCITAPHVGVNASILIAHLRPADMPHLRTAHTQLYVALNPHIDLIGFTENEFREHDDVCQFTGEARARWRTNKVSLDFVSAASLKRGTTGDWLTSPKTTITVEGVAAAALQHCMDFLGPKNPCAA